MLNSTVDTGDGKRHGMGWWTNPDFYGYRVVFGAGGSADSTAYFYTVPPEGIVVAVLSSIPQPCSEISNLSSFRLPALGSNSPTITFLDLTILAG